MKRRFILLYIIVSLITITGCNNKNSEKITFDTDNNGNYTGFDSAIECSSAEKAVEDGCYVKDGNNFSGTENWKEFLEAAARGEDTQLRMVILSEDNTNEYIDLFYHDGLYYAFKSASGDLDAKGYKYLLVLKEGKNVNDMTAYAVVLSNDDTLTFANIIDNLTSSKSIVIDEPYRIVDFGMKPV